MSATGYCEDCVKRQWCRKSIGIMFGFCNTDYEEDVNKDEDVNKTE